MDTDLDRLRAFDAAALAYEAWFQTPAGALVDRVERELVLRLLAPRPGERVLEVGAGTGHFLREVAATGAVCVGLEPSAAMLAAAAAAPDSTIAYARGQAEALPFRDAAFDAVLCVTVLEFVGDVAAAVREAARVVRPGGRLLFAVLNADGPWVAGRRRRGGVWTNARFFDAADLRARLAPFGKLTIEYAVHLPPGERPLPASLLALAGRVLGRLRPRAGALIGALVQKEA